MPSLSQVTSFFNYQPCVVILSNVVVNDPGAQFDIPGYEINSNGCPVKADAKGNCPLPSGLINNKYCGDVAVAAILGVDPATIISQGYDNDQRHYDYSTSADYWVTFINQNYKNTFHAEKAYPAENDQLGSWVHDQLQSGYALLSMVYIMGGNRGYKDINNIDASQNRAANVNGRVGGSGKIEHWVVITGISNQWKNTYNPGAGQVIDYPNSPWNWVRVYNPFMNANQYYWWGDFLPAWTKPDNPGHSDPHPIDFDTVLISQK